MAWVGPLHTRRVETDMAPIPPLAPAAASPRHDASNADAFLAPFSEQMDGELDAEFAELLDDARWRRLSFQLLVDDYTASDSSPLDVRAARHLPEAPYSPDASYHPLGPFVGAQRRTSRSIELDNPYIHRRYDSGPCIAPAALAGLPAADAQLAVPTAGGAELPAPLLPPAEVGLSVALPTPATLPSAFALGAAGLMERTLERTGRPAAGRTVDTHAARSGPPPERQQTLGLGISASDAAPYAERQPAPHALAPTTKSAPASPPRRGRGQTTSRPLPARASTPLPPTVPPQAAPQETPTPALVGYPAVAGAPDGSLHAAQHPPRLTSQPPAWTGSVHPSDWQAPLPAVWDPSAWLNVDPSFLQLAVETSAGHPPAACGCAECQRLAQPPPASTPTQLMPPLNYSAGQTSPAPYGRPSFLGQPMLATVPEAFDVESGLPGQPRLLGAFEPQVQVRQIATKSGAWAQPAAPTTPGVPANAPDGGYFSLPVAPPRVIAPLPTTPGSSYLQGTPPTTPGGPWDRGAPPRTSGQKASPPEAAGTPRASLPATPDASGKPGAAPSPGPARPTGEGKAPRTPQKRRGNTSPATTPQAVKSPSRAASLPSTPAKRTRATQKPALPGPGALPKSPGSPASPARATHTAAIVYSPTQGHKTPTLSLPSGALGPAAPLTPPLRRASTPWPQTPPVAMPGAAPEVSSSAASAPASELPKRRRVDAQPRTLTQPLAISPDATAEASAGRASPSRQDIPSVLRPVPVGGPTGDVDTERELRAPLTRALTWIKLLDGAVVALAPRGPAAAIAVSSAVVAACYAGVHLEAGLLSMQQGPVTVAYQLARPQALNDWLAQLGLDPVRPVYPDASMRKAFAEAGIQLNG